MKIPNKFLILTILCFVLLPVAEARAAVTDEYPIVKLRSLDKITAQTEIIEAAVGSTIKFGTLYIKVQACRKSPPIETPEAAAFLQIWEVNPHAKNKDEKASWVFSGWMFASSPGLSSMDHAIYDVWVLDCVGDKIEPPPEATEEGGEGGVPEEIIREELPAKGKKKSKEEVPVKPKKTLE